MPSIFFIAPPANFLLTIVIVKFHSTVSQFIYFKMKVVSFIIIEDLIILLPSVNLFDFRVLPYVFIFLAFRITILASIFRDIKVNLKEFYLFYSLILRIFY